MLVLSGLFLLLVPLAVQAQGYGEGNYGGGAYGEGEVGSAGGGGACLNCAVQELEEDDSETSATTSTEPEEEESDQETATCTLPQSGGLADLVELLISLAIIPAKKSDAACQAVANVTLEEPPSSGSAASFATDLELGDQSAGVRRLQAFLNAHGFLLADTGPGAPGAETDYFGALTLDAVKRFQEAYASEILAPLNLTTPTGYFGQSSRDKANALLGQS